ncbi:MAG: glycosyltransferase family 2 protein [Pseudomonadota bacterium]
MSERLLVFVPMYNCAPQIPRVLEQLADPQVAPWVDGVLCIDNGSRDGTVEAAEAALATVPAASRTLLRNDENYGLGGSHKVAIDFAEREGFETLVVLHGDDQGSIKDLIPHLENGAHKDVSFLMGARFMPGSRLQGYSALRTFANRAFNVIFSMLSGKRLYDLGSGLNLFRVSAFKDGFHRRFADNLTFNYYLILAIAGRKEPVRFFPLEWREDDQVSNAKLGRMGLQILSLLARYSRNRQRFFAAEHREAPRDAYPATVLARWETAGAETI